jgi:large subunit ribosomal protein L13
MKKETKKIERKYHLFDAKDKTTGKLAVEAAVILRGKNKVDFAPYIDAGDFVVVINSELIKISGGKEDKKVYHHFSGYPGGVSDRKLKEQMTLDSRKVIHDAVVGMLCKNKLRGKMIKRLFIYKNDQYKHKIDITH